MRRWNGGNNTCIIRTAHINNINNEETRAREPVSLLYCVTHSGSCDLTSVCTARTNAHASRIWGMRNANTCERQTYTGTEKRLRERERAHATNTLSIRCTRMWQCVLTIAHNARIRSSRNNNSCSGRTTARETVCSREICVEYYLHHFTEACMRSYVFSSCSAVSRAHRRNDTQWTKIIEIERKFLCHRHLEKLWSFVNRIDWKICKSVFFAYPWLSQYSSNRVIVLNAEQKSYSVCWLRISGFCFEASSCWTSHQFCVLHAVKSEFKKTTNRKLDWGAYWSRNKQRFQCVQCFRGANRNYASSEKDIWLPITTTQQKRRREERNLIG